MSTPTPTAPRVEKQPTISLNDLFAEKKKLAEDYKSAVANVHAVSGAQQEIDRLIAKLTAAPEPAKTPADAPEKK